MDQEMNSNNSKPLIFTLKEQHGRMAFQELMEKQPRPLFIDTYDDQVAELFEVRYPMFNDNSAKKLQFARRHYGRYEKNQAGNWIYYPFKNAVVHLLSQPLFEELRTARNYPLISKELQKKFSQLPVGIVGLSVGNSVALSLAYSGGCHTMKLADPDLFSLANLNRVRAGIMNVGQNKTVVAAQQIYEINPYATLSLYPEGVYAGNLKEFLFNPPIRLLIDECDNLLVKFHLRLAARALRIPLLMVTDNGFDINVDILRFDKTINAGGMSHTPHLSLDDIISGLAISEPLSLKPSEEFKLITDLIGVEHISLPMQQASALRVQGKISGWPQLGMTAFAAGVLASKQALALGTESGIKETQRTWSLEEK